MTAPVSERMKRFIPDGAKLYRAAGCAECGGTGYRGRLAVMEVLLVDAELERLIGAGDSAEKVLEGAHAAGMRSLFDAGIEHVLNGTTDIEELLRVLEVPLEQPVRGGPAVDRRVASKTPPVAPSLRTPLSSTLSSPRTHTPARGHAPAPSASFLPEDVLELVDDGSAPGLSKRAGKHTILLVEDEESLRLVLRDLLEREGYTIVEAADGVQALEEIDRSAPDIVVLDLNLPRLDGYGVLSNLRSKAATAHLPVVVLTAKGDEDSEVKVFEIGADDFLTKPFRPRALSARVKALLRRS
jgi:CheY-like chemotaxis protein